MDGVEDEGANFVLEYSLVPRPSARQSGNETSVDNSVFTTHYQIPIVVTKGALVEGVNMCGFTTASLLSLPL